MIKLFSHRSQLCRCAASRTTGIAVLASLRHDTPNAVIRPSQRRNFQLSALGDAVVLAADGISAIHAAGAPWYLSIPLVAVGVNFAIRLPVQYYTRRLIVRQSELSPLVSAWNSRHAATLSRTGLQDHAWRMRVAGLTEKERRRIYKTWGVQRWKTLAPFLNMVPFIIISEALRRLCGAPMGWISHSIGLANSYDPASLFDPDLAQGGCLWVVDLTAMDPYYALPLLSSALLAKTSWGRLSRKQLRALFDLDNFGMPQTPMMRFQTGIGRALLLVPLFPMLFADLPSAIFLYWASTFALNDVNESILSRNVPKHVPRLKMVQRTSSVAPYLKGSDTEK